MVEGGDSGGEVWKLTVLGIHKDDLEILVCGILIDPIRIQNAQISTPAPHSLLRRRPQALLVLELIDTLIRGFPIRSSLPSQSPRHKPDGIGPWGQGVCGPRDGHGYGR